MEDRSYRDQKYFIDDKVYNCPYCNRRNVRYENVDWSRFDWSSQKPCYIWLVKCTDCGNVSMHLSYFDIGRKVYQHSSERVFRADIDLDSHIFYSVPTSFFVIDSRIPRVLRELVTEAEGCLKMNFLTGASACTRKAIYEFTVNEKAEGGSYEEKIKYLKGKFPNIDPDYFDILCGIKDMTSDKVHEQSWDEWNSQHIKLFLETLRAVFHEIYVVPDERRERVSAVQALKSESKKKEKESVNQDKVKR